MSQDTVQASRMNIRVNTVNYWALLFCMIGLYTYVGISDGSSIVVPVVAAAIFSFPLLLLNRNRIKQKHILIIASILGLSVLSIVFTSGIDEIWDKMRGLLFFAYSILISYGLYLGFTRMSHRAAERFAYVFMISILVGCFFENYLGLRVISDAFRNIVFPIGVYDASDRDIVYFGMIRPKFFTSEPSFVATFFVMISTVWLILSISEKKYFNFFIFSFLGLFLIGSPMILIAVANGAVIFFFNNREKINYLTIVKYFMVVLTGLMLIVGMLSTVLEARFDRITSGGDDSFTLRVIAPVYMTMSVLSDNPFFGSGISGSEMIRDNIIEGAIKADLVDLDASKITRVQNTFWMIWMSFGLFGGALFIFIMYKFIKSLGVNEMPLCVVLILILTQAGTGTPYTPRFWAYMMIIVAALVIADRESQSKKKVPLNVKPEF